MLSIRGINVSVICSQARRSIMTESIKYLWFQDQYDNDLGSLFVHWSLHFLIPLVKFLNEGLENSKKEN